MRRPKPVSLLAAVAVLATALALAACGSSSSSSSSSGGSRSAKLSLVAYSTPKEAYAAIIPAFNKTAAGKGVSFTQSYGASGDQSRAVASGLAADVVAFSLSPDVNRLVKSGQVAADWNAGPYKGNVTDSVVVLAVRKGNPKHIAGWDDLVKKGVDVITPNPISSGGARWNIMAAYGAQIKQGKTPQQALDYLKKLFKNVPVLPKSAREATQVFASGKGDVLLTYENEAIYANKKGVHTEYVLPKQTILIENPVALTKNGLKHSEAKAFLKFLWSSKAQKLFGDTGYRPVLKSVAKSAKYKYPKPKSLFTINSKSLGLRGWKSVQFRFFDHSSGIMVKVIGR